MRIIHINTNEPNRSIVFDNNVLMNTLLDSLTPLDAGLRNEIEYIRKMNL